MKVLMSCDGFGGLTVANFLYRQGHETIIINKAHQFSNAGFVNFLKPKGDILRKMDFETINKNLADSIMATRTSLNNLLYDALKDKVEIKFNSTIKTVEQSKKGAAVQLLDNSSGLWTTANLSVARTNLSAMTVGTIVFFAQLECM